MLRDHTREGNPALYLPTVDIQRLETDTAQKPERLCLAKPMKREYLRDVGTVIGWDDGHDATLSFVECAGGTVTRAFHGRPMHALNQKTSKAGWTLC